MTMAQRAHSADGIPIVFDVRGAGSPALVFVHGWSCDRSYWAGQLDHFAASHQVVSIDLAGHGDSGGGRADWTMGAFGEDVAAVAMQLRLDRVVLIGHSMGGDVIVEAALRLSSRVAGLVWVDTYRRLDGILTPADEFEKKTAPFRQDFPGATRPFVASMFPSSADPTLVEWVVADMASAPAEVAIGSLQHAWSCEPATCAALRTLSVPRVAINPGDGPSDIDSLAGYGFRTVVQPDVGHFLMMEDPAAFNRLLSQVVEGIASVTVPGRQPPAV
jgi:pimeloyl-ACP methyl ester carboxylesterase